MHATAGKASTPDPEPSPGRGPDFSVLITAAPLFWLALGQSNGGGQLLLVGLGAALLSVLRWWPRHWRTMRWWRMRGSSARARR